MINYKTTKLKNGLIVISDYIPDTPMATFSLAYKVGSKHEDPNKTGLAHLFEHIMFGGSKNVAHYDQHVESAGGTSNAFTTSDYTNYYVTMPAPNIETAFYIEADRMFNPNLSEQSLEVQRKVVIEEYKQRVLNPPYGDLMSNLLPLAYKSHSYKWPVIGAEIEHIKGIQLNDLREFHSMFYQPSNAVLVVSGNVRPDAVFQMAEKWFGVEQGSELNMRKSPVEDRQIEFRQKVVQKDIPMDMITMAYHMGPRDSRAFYCGDLLSDVLSFDRSSRFHQYLNQNNAAFTSLTASVTGSVDSGLFIVKGKLNQGVSIDEGMKIIDSQLNQVQNNISELEVEKVINKLLTFQKVGYLEHANRAMDLCYAEVVKNPEYINEQFIEYEKTTHDEIQKYANTLFQPQNLSLLIYKNN